MPNLSSQLRLRLRSLFRRTQVEQELDEELRYHLDRQIEESVAKGLSVDEARDSALRALGAITQNQEECRDMRRVTWIENAIQDLRYGARTLRKNLSFTTVAVLALALGIGANTAMFSVAYGMLFRPLPYADAGRVVVVFMSYFPRDFKFGTMSIRDYLIWTENNRSFERPALFRTLRMDIGGNAANPEQVQGASVTAGFFPTLGARPLIGRTFRVGEDKPGSGSLAVLSESIWRRRFGATSEVLGQTISVNGAPSVVIGVMSGSFRFPPGETEVWTNLPLNPPARYGPWFYRAVARLNPGVTLPQAQAELNNIGARMMQQNPYYKHLTLPVLTLRDALLGTQLKPALLILISAVGLVLLIAVVNVANLMLARGTVRQREMALRLSLGAGRGRLMRQLLTESVLLAVLGGVAGLALAWGGVQLIRAWNPGGFALIDSVRLDWTALWFMMLVSVSAGVMFGIAPAFESARTDLNPALKEGGRAGAGQTRGRTRAVLVISEIAISLMLLVGAGLLLRSFLNLQQVTGGFSTPPRQLLTMLISPGNAKYNEVRAGTAFYDEVLRKARNVPGVEMAALTDSLPPDRQGDADTFVIEGQNLAAGELNPIVSVVTATPGLFETLGIPLIRGRYFTPYDTRDSKPVAIVSEGFARRFFPNQEALGKRFKHSGPGSGEDWMMEIVGITGNVKYLGLTVDTDPCYYMPFTQNYSSRMFLVVRSTGGAAGVAASLRHDLQSIDPDVTLAQIETMEQALNSSVSQPRFDTMLLALFAGIALLLAAVGIYGLISYSVAQRRHEIGVRMALGAAQGNIVLMVVRQGVMLAAIGLSLGLGGAFILTRGLKAMLFDVGITDALTFTAAPLAMMVVVLLATSMPALRAARISPLVALRE